MIWFYLVLALVWFSWFDLWTQVGWMLYGAGVVWPLTTILYFYYFHDRHERNSRLKKKEVPFVVWYLRPVWYMRFGVLLLILLLAFPIWIYTDIF